tara:strand:+ start:98 stop:463 length:366 start_codon:yes stop_codon:yes gene_type:complete
MPNNMKKAGIKYGHGGGAKPYKYKGQNVPGMYQTGGGPEIGLPPKKRNLFGRIGAGIGNIFRNDANDRSIKYQGYKNDQVGSGPVIKNPYTGPTSNPFGKPKLGMNGGMRRGGSIGPNGTL